MVLHGGPIEAMKDDGHTWSCTGFYGVPRKGKFAGEFHGSGIFR